MDGTHADAAGVAPAAGTEVAAGAPPPTGHDPSPTGGADPPPQAALHGGDYPSRGGVADAGGSSSAAAARPPPSAAPAPATDAGAADSGGAGAGSSSAAVTPAAAAAASAAPLAPLIVTLIVKNPGARGARPPLRLEVPLDGTTIGGVKSVLTGLVPGAPPVSAQRLIFAGHLLKNGQSTLWERGGVAPTLVVGPTARLSLVVHDLLSSLTCRRLLGQRDVVRCAVVRSWGRATTDLHDVLVLVDSLLSSAYCGASSLPRSLASSFASPPCRSVRRAQPCRTSSPPVM